MFYKPNRFEKPEYLLFLKNLVFKTIFFEPEIFAIDSILKDQK